MKLIFDLVYHRAQSELTDGLHGTTAAGDHSQYKPAGIAAAGGLYDSAVPIAGTRTYACTSIINFCVCAVCAHIRIVYGDRMVDTLAASTETTAVGSSIAHFTC